MLSPTNEPFIAHHADTDS